MKYYCFTEGSEITGPYSIPEVAELIQAGALSLETQVCAEDESNWEPVTAILSMDPSIARPETPAGASTFEPEPNTTAVNSPPAPSQLHRRRRVFLALAVLVFVFLAGIVFAVMHLATRSTASAADTSASASGSTTPQPGSGPSEPAPLEAAPVLSVATPEPIPSISADTKERILALIEKASRLRVMSEQGVSLEEFRTQLSDVRAVWETIAIAGMPRHLDREGRLLESSVSAWVLAQDIWSSQLAAKAETQGLGTRANRQILFTLKAGAMYGDRLIKIRDQLQADGASPPDVSSVSDKQQFSGYLQIQYMQAMDVFVKNISTASGDASIDLERKWMQEASDEIEKVAYEALGAEASPLLGIKETTRHSAASAEKQNPPIVIPDAALQWCFAAAGVALENAKAALSTKFRQETQ